MPPDNFENWYDLIKALAKHLVERYGLAEVSSWHFEVWNEMWGVNFPDPYLSLYNASALALKAVDTSLKVGGPATMQTLDVGAFINATRGKLPVDFVSTHFYPTDPQCQTNATKSLPDCFAHTVLAAQGLARDANLPFFITEYNNGLGASSRDDSSAAAFVIRQIGLLDQLDMLSWWTFSDVFEEGWLRSDPFHNGYGMMTVHGIRKPVWRAFEMLAAAGDRRLPVHGFISPSDEQSDISVLATKHEERDLDVHLYISNYHRLANPLHFSCDAAKGQCRKDPDGAYTDEALCNANCGKVGGDKASNTTQRFELTILHSASSSQELPDFVNGYRIDVEHANPLAKWHQLGAPKYPTPSEVEAMSHASLVGAEKIPLTRLNSTASMVSLDILPNSVMYIPLASHLTTRRDDLVV